jgi:PTS system galactitol-specific IIA component
MSALLDIPSRFFVARLVAATDRDVITLLAKELGEHVLPSFAEAACAREKRSPTGLPFGDVAVAIPHAEPEHVKSPAIVIASLAAPVRFRQMGSPRTFVEVSLVVMPALTAKEQAAATLSGIITLLQDATIRAALAAATTTDAMQAALLSGAPAGAAST